MIISAQDVSTHFEVLKLRTITRWGQQYITAVQIAVKIGSYDFIDSRFVIPAHILLIPKKNYLVVKSTCGHGLDHGVELVGCDVLLST